MVHTEMDMARRVATRFSARNAFDYFELTPQVTVFEIETPREWEGRTVSEVDVRRRYNVNILGVKNDDGEVEALRGPDYVFQADAHLIIAGDKEAGIRLMDTES